MDGAAWKDMLCLSDCGQQHTGRSKRGASWETHDHVTGKCKLESSPVTVHKNTELILKGTTVNTDIKKQSLATKVKWGLLALTALVVAPVVFLVIQGIIGLVIIGLLGLVVATFAEPVAMKFANWKLKAVKAEAMANPVETLQNVYREKEEAINQLAQRIEDFATEVRNFADQLMVFRKEHPEEVEKFESTHRAMCELLAVRQQRIREARGELVRFQNEIEKAGSIYTMALAAQRMHKAAGMTEDNFMQRIKTGTAIDSVQSSLNRALAQLETAVAEEMPAIENNPSEFIDGSSVVSDVRAIPVRRQS